MVVTYTVPVTPECPAVCVPISPVVPAVSTVPLEVGAITLEVGAIVAKMLTVLVHVAPIVLVVLGHLSEALGTCTGGPERHSHQTTNDPARYASHGHIPHLQGDAWLLGRSRAWCSSFLSGLMRKVTPSQVRPGGVFFTLPRVSLVYPRFYFLYISKPYATERAGPEFCVMSAC